MDAGGALIEFGEIQNLVHRLLALHGSGMIVIHGVRRAGADAAGAGNGILALDVKILDKQSADRNGHPAILPAMIVNAADLANFPADGHNFEEITLENEIPRVMAFGVEKIGLQSVRRNRMPLEIAFDVFKSELFAMDFREAANPFVNVQLRHTGLLARTGQCGVQAGV